MPIEFHCPSCQQQLRVPDAAAGKNARCPSCSTVVKVPETSQPAASSPLSPPTQPGFNFGPPEPKPSAPAGGGSFGAPPPSNPIGVPPSGNPFGDASPMQPWGGDKGPINPYASPAGGFNQPVQPSGQFGHQIVEVGPILNYSMRVWQDNLGLLIGTLVVGAILGAVVGFPAGVVLGIVAVNAGPIAGLAVGLVLQLGVFVLTTFLGIGQGIIHLKLARGQRAEFSDLFSGGSRLLQMGGLLLMVNGPTIFLQTVGTAFSVQRGNLEIQMAANMLVLLWSLIVFILALIYYPAYYLVLEGRATVFQSFPLAAQITAGNRLHIFLMFLLMIGISILGALACGVGLLFAIPLTQVMLAVAYLMMSAQLSTTPGYQQR